jgi:bifunctional non-homologous end joining protein LigD
MALETYRKKRDFATTSEPRGGRARKSGNSFVIQKHDATRLHYDFRLEMDGTLKSWAVTRGPSLLPGEKRLAVHVEDHPLEYGDFEGTIPKGEYGGGTVIVWDRGTWTPIHDAHKGYAKGHLEFALHGEKLGGHWHLIRMHGKPREKHENWLLIKGEDEAARSEGDPDILVEHPESVKTGRQIEDVAGEEPGWSSKTGKIEKKGKPVSPPKKNPAPSARDPSKIKGAKPASLPAFQEPMLATLVSRPPAGDRWIHEIKFDGYRLQARIESGRVKLLTRSGLDWTGKFGKDIVTALQALPVKTALLDGELVVEAASGASDFSALQADLSEGRSDRFVYYVFDIPHLDGADLTALPLMERKKLLEPLIGGTSSGLVRYSGHFDENGALVLRHACRLSLEGVVSKARDAPYRGGRGKNWVKSKCADRQEFVVAGYVPSTTVRNAIGSLVLGVYEGSELRHVGRVGTGFTVKIAENLFGQLSRMQVRSSPFAPRLTAEEARQVLYVRPEFVAEVEFRAWTGDGHLRHASFRGLREDKPAQEIVREMAKSPPPSSAPPEPKPQQRTVKLTHPDRIYWPDKGVTKEGLADYYAEVWPHIAPFIVGRALALLRCPDGITGEHFFQKHAWKGLNPHIALVKDPKDSAAEPLISINDLDGLMALAQSAVLEIHPWGSTIGEWERPDTIIMDLDPGEGVSWQTIIAAAKETRDRLNQAGLTAFVKTSGGKGLHVVSPLVPKAEWPAVKMFTKTIADAMASDSPDRFVSTITKSKRQGKILVDYLRNQRGATAVAAYSTRARPGAAVSAPLSWDELGEAIGPAYFTVENMPPRLVSLRTDPWEGFRAAAAPLEGAKRRRRKIV